MKKLIFTLFLALICSFISAQKQEVFKIDSLPKQGVLLKEGWKWQAGDNPNFAKADFDDSKWEGIDPTRDIYYLPQVRKSTVGWLRIHLDIDSALLNKALAFQIKQTAASEVFLNGKRLKSYGVVSNQAEQVKAFDPAQEPSGLLFNQTNQVIAIRFSVQERLPYFAYNNPFVFFRFRIREVQDTDRFNQNRLFLQYMNLIYGGLFLLLGLIHLGFFISFPKKKANLYFSLFALSASVANFLYFYTLRNNDIGINVYAAIIEYIFLCSFFGLFLLLSIHNLFPKPKGLYFWFLVIYSLFGFVIGIYSFKWGFRLGFIVPLFLCNIASFRIALSAYLQGKRAANLLVFGIGGHIVLYLGFILMMLGILPYSPIGNDFLLMDLFYHSSMVVISLSFSIYLAREFAFTSKDLEKKLEEVQQLSAENQQILATQNETLERQVEERTAELKASQNQLIQSEKLASLGELTAGIAHEIQNPLNFVNNFSEVSAELVQEIKEERQKPKENQDESLVDEIFNDISQNLEKITLHGKRASSIVKGMLEHSRTSTGVKEPTDINALADEYMRLSYHGIKAKDSNFNSDYQTDLDENLPKIEVIPQDIGRVLLNLINNAFWAVNERCKKGEAGYEPKVIVKTSSLSSGEGRGEVCVEIIDNGTGMSETTKAKIFQPFFTTKPTGQGTGLGLSLAYDIVTKGHGGALEVESVEGGGTTFVVKLLIV